MSKRYCLPWCRIAWNLLWVLPLIATQCLFVLVVMGARGVKVAGRVWDETR